MDCCIARLKVVGEEALVRVLEGTVGAKITLWLLAPAGTFQLPRTGFILAQLTRLLETLA